MEVKEKRLSCVAEVEVRHYLRGVNRRQALSALYLDDDAVFDQEVKPVAAGELNAFEGDRQRNFATDLKSTTAHLVFQASLVRAFHQAWTETAMYFNCRTDHDISDGTPLDG